MNAPASVKVFLSRWLQLVEESGVEEFKRVLKTFKTWETEIQEGLTNVYSNGFTEGMNKKNKSIETTSLRIPKF